MLQNDTIFGKIIRKELPADIVYEDEICLAFKDINPVAPTHLLIIPKKYIRSMATLEPETEQSILGHCLAQAHHLGKALQLDTGYRLVINTGSDANQTVPHLHIHLIGGRPLSWPPG